MAPRAHRVHRNDTVSFPWTFVTVALLAALVLFFVLRVAPSWQSAKSAEPTTVATATTKAADPFPKETVTAYQKPVTAPADKPKLVPTVPAEKPKTENVVPTVSKDPGNSFPDRATERKAWEAAHPPTATTAKPPTVTPPKPEEPKTPVLADAKVGQTFWITPLRVIMDGTEWKLWVDATETSLPTENFYDKLYRLKGWSAKVVAVYGDTGMVEVMPPEGTAWFFQIDPYAGQALLLKSPDGGSPIRLGLARTVLKHKYWQVRVRYSDGRMMEVVPRDQRPDRLCEAIEGQECWISQRFIHFGSSLRRSKESAYWADSWAPISSHSGRKDDLGPWVKIRPKVGSHLQWATTFHEADLLSEVPDVQELNWSDTVVSDLMTAIYWVRWWQADRTRFVSPACISLCIPDGQRPNRRPK